MTEATGRKTRARAMAPNERREAIIEATLPLLVEHGRETTTKQIAAAAGIAEGTIFRVFDSKDALFEASLEQAFDPQDFLDAVHGVAVEETLDGRLLGLTRVMQDHFSRVFALMIAMALTSPRHRTADKHEWRERVMDAMAELVEPWAEEFRVSVPEVVDLLRLLTFSGSHPHISEQRLDAERIVDVVLHGTHREGR